MSLLISQTAPETGIIVQARMGSTRLPGKVLMPFYENRSILEILLQRLQQNAARVPVWLATSALQADDAVATVAAEAGVGCFRGHETDVLQRFTQAAQQAGFTRIIRVCADNPFLDAGLLDELIAASMVSTADYCSYQLSGALPAIRSHWGIFAEYVTLDALKRAADATADMFYHEHVTNYIYGHPEKFNVQWINAPEGVYENLSVRLTIDTPEDFAALQQLYTDLANNSKPITFKNILAELKSRPALREEMQRQIDRFQK
ncbi:MAG: glycosyl transferase family 2 [Bacteroidia bacterium]|jgi:spore coat polysaccharide biosynthesis protein SpsF|nr:glycosyl transferase family 2 [Bacteroidia bacterium]